MLQTFYNLIQMFRSLIERNVSEPIHFYLRNFSYYWMQLFAYLAKFYYDYFIGDCYCYQALNDSIIIYYLMVFYLLVDSFNSLDLYRLLIAIYYLLWHLPFLVFCYYQIFVLAVYNLLNFRSSWHLLAFYQLLITSFSQILISLIFLFNRHCVYQKLRQYFSI